MKRFIWCIAALAVFITVMQTPALSVSQGPLLGAWTAVTTSGTYTPRTHAVGVYSNNRIWVIGGIRADGTTVGTVETLVTFSKAWQAKTDMPTPRRDASAVVVNVNGQDKIYVIGGYGLDDKPTGAVEMLDPVAGTWTAKTAMPTPRAGAVAVPYTTASGSIQIHVYGGDATDSYPKDHAYEIYDITADKWSPAAVIAPSAQVAATGVNAKDYGTGNKFLYLFGGYSGGSAPSPGAWQIDPKAGTDWDSSVHVMPDGRIFAAAVTVSAVDENSRATGDTDYPLIIGGNTDRNGTYTAKIAAYESRFNGWIEGTDVGPDLPEAKGDRPIAVIVGTNLWVLGGGGPSGASSTVFQAPINTSNYPPRPALEDTMIVGWEDMKCDIPTPRQQVASGVLTDSDGAQKLYVAGGVAATGPDGSQSPIYNVLEAYDPAQNKWITKAPMPHGVMKAACAVLNNKLYVYGGAVDRVMGTSGWADTIIRMLQIYDPTTDTWTVKDYTASPDALPTARERTESYAYGGKFYVLGGEDSTHNSSGANEVYDPATDTWAVTQWPNGSNTGCPWAMCDSASFVLEDGDFAWFYMVGGGLGATQVSNSALTNMGPAPSGYTWAQIASVPVGGISGDVGMVVQDPISGVKHPMIFGGDFGPVGKYNSTFTYYDVNDVAHPNKWLTDTPMPMKRASKFAIAQFGQYVYIAAGEGPGPNGLIPNTIRGQIGSALPQDVTNIGEVLAMPNGKKVNFKDPKIVTRAYTSLINQQTYFWIQDDQSAALKVGPSTASVMPGNKVTLSGAIGADPVTGERLLKPSTIVVDPNTYTIPNPIGISQKSFLGGTKAQQIGRPGAVGLNNLGMLARVCGKVTLTSPWWVGYDSEFYFYIDDGSGLMDGTSTNGVPNQGLRIYFAATNPDVGQYVSVTGIISYETIDGNLTPMLLSDEIMSAPAGAPESAIRIY